MPTDDPALTVAQMVPRTEAEGPGWRFALWGAGLPPALRGQRPREHHP